MATDPTYQPKVYSAQGGDETIVKSGGKITVESGGVLDVLTGGIVKANGTQASAIAALTAASGTADGTVADVGSSFNQGTLNDNFQEMATKINLILTAIKNAGVIA